MRDVYYRRRRSAEREEKFSIGRILGHWCGSPPLVRVSAASVGLAISDGLGR